MLKKMLVYLSVATASFLLGTFVNRLVEPSNQQTGKQISSLSKHYGASLNGQSSDGKIPLAQLNFSIPLVGSSGLLPSSSASVAFVKWTRDTTLSDFVNLQFDSMSLDEPAKACSLFIDRKLQEAVLIKKGQKSFKFRDVKLRAKNDRGQVWYSLKIVIKNKDKSSFVGEVDSLDLRWSKLEMSIVDTSKIADMTVAMPRLSKP